MMPESSTITVRLPNELKAKLERLALHTRRTRSVLAHEALTDYVDRELEIIEAIDRGRADIRSDRFHATEEVFADVDAAIAEVEAGRASR